MDTATNSSTNTSSLLTENTSFVMNDVGAEICPDEVNEEFQACPSGSQSILSEIDSDVYISLSNSIRNSSLCAKPGTSEINKKSITLKNRLLRSKTNKRLAALQKKQNFKNVFDSSVESINTSKANVSFTTETIQTNVIRRSSTFRVRRKSDKAKNDKIGEGFKAVFNSLNETINHENIDCEDGNGSMQLDVRPQLKQSRFISRNRVNNLSNAKNIFLAAFETSVDSDMSKTLNQIDDPIIDKVKIKPSAFHGRSKKRFCNGTFESAFNSSNDMTSKTNGVMHSEPIAGENVDASIATNQEKIADCEDVNGSMQLHLFPQLKSSRFRNRNSAKVLSNAESIFKAAFDSSADSDLSKTSSRLHVSIVDKDGTKIASAFNSSNGITNKETTPKRNSETFEADISHCESSKRIRIEEDYNTNPVVLVDKVCEDRVVNDDCNHSNINKDNLDNEELVKPNKCIDVSKTANEINRPENVNYTENNEKIDQPVIDDNCLLPGNPQTPNISHEKTLAECDNLIGDRMITRLSLPQSDVKGRSNGSNVSSIVQSLSIPNNVTVNNSREKNLSENSLSISQPTPVLHIESDYDSMLSSSDSEGEELSAVVHSTNVKADNSSKVNAIEVTSFAKNDSKDLFKSPSRIALAEINNTKRRSVVRKSSLNANNNQKENVSIAAINEGFNSMEMTMDSMEKSEYSVSVPGSNISNKSQTLTTPRRSPRLTFAGSQISNSVNTSIPENNSGDVTETQPLQTEHSIVSGKDSSINRSNHVTRSTSVPNQSKAVNNTTNQDILRNIDNSANQSSVIHNDKSLNNSRKRLSSKNRSSKPSKAASLREKTLNQNLTSLYDISLSELQEKYRRNRPSELDAEIIDRALTFKRKITCSSPNTSANRTGANRTVANRTVANSFIALQNKTPVLKKPKDWVTNNLYNFLIGKLEPTYKMKSRKRAEKFVVYLCNTLDKLRLNVAQPTQQQLVNALVIEMERFQMIRNLWDFYGFCHQYLPHQFYMKYVPILQPFGKPPNTGIPGSGQIPFL